MNNLTQTAEKRSGVFLQLGAVLLLSMGLAAAICLFFFIPAQAGVQAEVDANGRLVVRATQPEAVSLHIDNTAGALHVSSADGVSFDGRTGKTVQIPLSTLASSDVDLIFGAENHSLVASPGNGSSLSLRTSAGAVSLDATGDLHLPVARLHKPLSIRMDDEGQSTLALGTIAAASLTISGDNVVLAGPVTVTGDVRVQARDQLHLRQSQLHAAGNVWLQANDTLTVRDSATQPVIAQVGGVLQLQGDQQIDISALGHPASVLASGGDMGLRSLHPVRGDALYLAGGTFAIARPDGRAGDLVSPYDPVVLADGDVSLGSYTGASLHILAGGSVLLDSAVITGTDTPANTINAANTTPFNGSDTIADLASLTLSNGTPLALDGSARATLDVRAGVDWTTFAGGAPGDQVIPPGALPPAFAPASGASITVTGAISIAQPGGLALLTNQYRPNAALSGSITAGDIDASTNLLAQDGGSIILDSRGHIASGGLQAFAQVSGSDVEAGNAGTITALAANGAINTTGDVNAFTRTPANSSGPVGDGGDILMMATGGIDVNSGNNSVNAFAFSNANGAAGSGGDITLVTAGGDIIAQTLNSASFTTITGTVTASSGGHIIMHTDNGRIIVPGNGFSIVALSSFVQSGGVAGNGGNIVLTATQGISVGRAVHAQANGENGNGGDVRMTTSNNDIATGNILAHAADNGLPGSGGNVSLQAPNGGVAAGDIWTFSNALVIHNDSQDGGDIVVQALGGDVLTGELLAYSEARGLQGDTGEGGEIAVTAGGSITAGGAVETYALASANNNNSGVAGNGGHITLQATAAISVAGGVDASSSATGENGTATNGGNIAMTASSGNIRIESDVDTGASAPGFPSGDAGDGGEISLVAASGIAVGGGLNAQAASQEGTVGSGGHISATTSSGDVTIELANASARNPFASNSLSTGDGGHITLATGNGRIDVNPDGLAIFNALNSESAGADVTGNGGNIVVTATQGISLGGSVRALASGAQGNGGSVRLATSGGNVTSGDIFAGAIDNDDAPGSSGDVIVEALDGSVSTGDVLAYSYALFIHNDAQDGGNITVAALNGDAQTGELASFTEARGLQGDTGDAGLIAVTASDRITATGPVQAYALAAINNNNSGTAGNAGDVTLQASGTISIAGGIDTSSAAPGPNGVAANAGSATVAAGGDVLLRHVDARSRAASGTIGSGGTVRISTPQFVGATDTIFNTGETIASAGLAGSSAITITHGGSGITPFVVGTPSPNGTRGALNSGDALITPTLSFLYSYHQPPNIWILSVPLPLTLTKRAVPDTDVAYHGEITYTLTLSNPASVDAIDVLLTDTLPVEVDFLRWVQQPVGADIAAGVLTWRGDVATGSEILFVFVVAHNGDAGDVFTNTAEFAHPPTLGSGTATAMASIEAASNLAMRKTAARSAAAPGETIQYILAFTNAGPGAARNVVITDVVPAELANLSVTSSGVPVTPLGGSSFAWTVPELAAGQGGVITITGDLVVPLARGLVFSNTAVITAATFEADATDNQETAAITVLNAAPQAVDDTAATDEDTVATVAVLANDSDPNGDGLTLLAVGVPGAGAAALNGDTVVYTPTQDFNGTDTFTYTVGDGLLASTAMVTMTVNPINDAPVAAGNAYTTAEETPFTVIAAAGVLSNDVDVDDDPLAAILVDDVASGALSLQADGGFTYTPALNFTGLVTFTYQAADGVALSNVATVTITVGEANDAPLAVGDLAMTDEDTAVTIDVLFNDSDPDGDTLAVIGTGTAHGSATIRANKVAYTPALNFNGTDVFTYTVSDGQLSATAVVSVTVNPVNDAPHFTSTPPPAATVDTLYLYTVTAVDVDANDQLVIEAPVLPAWLALVDQGRGTAVLSGTPTAAEIGDHAVTLVASDGELAATQSFTITVTAAPTIYRLYLPSIMHNPAAPVRPSDLVVADLIVAGDAITVVVENVGAGPTPHDFWVDVYVNPSETPSLNRTWQLIAEQGLAWGVTDPIPPGGSLTLTIGGAYYVATESAFDGLVAGDEVWAQVDSVNLATTYGNVMEDDETNNVTGPVSYGAAVRPAAAHQ